MRADVSGSADAVAVVNVDSVVGFTLFDGMQHLLWLLADLTDAMYSPHI